MTTTHTHRIAILAETGNGPQNRLDVEPGGDHLLWAPDAPPDYRDADGTEYRYAESSWTPEVEQALRGVQNAPQIEVVDTAEVVPVSDIDGREVIWRDDHNGVAMVRTVSRDEVTEGLERIETEEAL